MNEMSRAGWLKWVAITVGVAAAAVPLSFVFWRTPPGVAAPPPSMLPILIPIAVVIPALAFGLGVAFVLFGRQLIRANRPSALSRASLVSIAWLLTNWWPHSNFHRVSSGWANLVAVDYFFHTTVIIASCIVAVFFLSVLRDRQTADQVDGGIRDLQSAPTT
jgi:hypothetical protein